MKFTVQTSEMLKAVNTAIRAIPAHSTMQILMSFVIEARGDKIIVSANNLEMGIRTSISGTVEVPGCIAVDAKMFSDIVKKAPADTMVMETDEKYNLEITSGKAKFYITGACGEDFPSIPEVDRSDSVEVPQAGFRMLITKTIFCLATMDNNKLLTGAFLETRDGEICMTALDGHRVGFRKLELEGCTGNRKAVIPGKTLTEIGKILPEKTEENITICFDKSLMLFEAGNTIITSRLIDGEYFNVRQMMSNDYATKITVSRNQIQSCVDRSTLFVREGDKKPLILDISDHQLDITMASPMGSMHEELDIEKEGADLSIGFNPKLANEAIKAVDDENISFYFTAPKAPCLLRDGATNEESSYIYMLLPVNFVR